MRESPVVAPNTYWLATDNALAVYTLTKLGDRELAGLLQSTLDSYEYVGHGLIEMLWGGQEVQWPPHVETQRLVRRIGKKEIWLETRDSGPQFEDWEEYTDLAMMGALNAFYRGNRANANALQIYQQALKKFDGVGFADKAFYSGEERHYATYKLALALYTGVVLNAPLEEIGPTLLEALLQKQAASGGFHALYDGPTELLADPNTETTCYGLLALNAYLSWVR